MCELVSSYSAVFASSTKERRTGVTQKIPFCVTFLQFREISNLHPSQQWSRSCVGNHASRNKGSDEYLSLTGSEGEYQ